MKLREALQESVNALRVLLYYQSDANKPTIHEYGQAHRALAAARAALAERGEYPPDAVIAQCMLAVDDPLLWGRLGESSGDIVRKFARAVIDSDRAQRVPLTEAEIERCRQEGYAHSGLSATFDFCKAARAVERMLGIGAKP